MSQIFTYAGSFLYISAETPDSYDVTGYNALAYTMIKGVRVVGSIGERKRTVEKNELGKVSRNDIVGTAPNSLPIEIYTLNDSGQTLLKTLYDTEETYSFKFLLSSGKAYYFTAVCSERFANPAEAKSIADMRAILEINSRMLEIP